MLYTTIYFEVYIHGLSFRNVDMCALSACAHVVLCGYNTATKFKDTDHPFISYGTFYAWD